MQVWNCLPKNIMLNEYDEMAFANIVDKGENIVEQLFLSLPYNNFTLSEPNVFISHIQYNLY